MSVMPAIEKEFIPTFEVPVWVLEVLRPEALLKGSSNGKSSIARWGLIWAAERIREEKKEEIKQAMEAQSSQNGKNVGVEHPVS